MWTDINFILTVKIKNFDIYTLAASCMFRLKNLKLDI